MDKLSDPNFAVQCSGHAVKMWMRDGRWAYRYPDGGLGFPGPTEAGLADLLQQAREIIFRLKDNLSKCCAFNLPASWAEASDFLVSTGVPPSPASQSLAPAPAEQPVVACQQCGYIPVPSVERRATASAAEPPVLLSRVDGPTLDSSVAKEHREMYVHLFCQAHAINVLADAVEQLRRQQAGGCGG